MAYGLPPPKTKTKYKNFGKGRYIITSTPTSSLALLRAECLKV
jgi:hypothetical protein